MVRLPVIGSVCRTMMESPGGMIAAVLGSVLFFCCVPMIGSVGKRIKVNTQRGDCSLISISFSAGASRRIPPYLDFAQKDAFPDVRPPLHTQNFPKMKIYQQTS